MVLALSVSFIYFHFIFKCKKSKISRIEEGQRGGFFRFGTNLFIQQYNLRSKESEDTFMVRGGLIERRGQIFPT